MITSFSSLALAVSAVYPLAGSSKLYPLSCRVPLYRVLSACLLCSLCSQLLIGQSFVKGRENEAIKPFERVIFDVSEVQPERKFSNVSVKMFRANVMINAGDAELL